MAYMSENAQLRARSRFARILTYVRNSLNKKPQLPRDLSDHIARDIGLSDHEIECLRHQLPSQSDKRPMI